MRSPIDVGGPYEPVAEQPAVTGAPRWADGHEPEVGVERRRAVVRRSDAEVDPWRVGERVVQRLEQPATDAVPLRSGEQVDVEVGRDTR